jgi:hypothetical protein
MGSLVCPPCAVSASLWSFTGGHLPATTGEALESTATQGFQHTGYPTASRGHPRLISFVRCRSQIPTFWYLHLSPHHYIICMYVCMYVYSIYLLISLFNQFIYLFTYVCIYLYMCVCVCKVNSASFILKLDVLDELSQNLFPSIDFFSVERLKFLCKFLGFV